MIHDPILLERLSALPIEKFDGEAYRATRTGLNPLAFSTCGGRWARSNGSAVLYTSLEHSGALAEICFHWGQLSPLPTKPAMLHRLRVATHQTRRLIRADLSEFEIDPNRFQDLNYERTQAIGEAVAFLECDGLIAPSARWNCDNLVLFNDNSAACDLELITSEKVDWISWARDNGFIE